MRQLSLLLLAIGACVLLGVGIATAVDSQTDAPSAGGPVDNAPAGPASVGAQLDAPSGDAFGVATYRRSDGTPCFAGGRVRDGVVGAPRADGGFTAKPLDQGGTCLHEEAPAGVVVKDLPGATGTMVVYGRARPSITAVRLTTGGERRSARLAEDGSFVATFAGPFDETVTLTLTDASGATRTIDVPPPPEPPSMDDVRREAEAMAGTPHAEEHR